MQALPLERAQQRAVTVCLLLMTVALGGCRNRAYNDIYVENMAAEIRDLEDQLYEYDYEYRLLEQKAAALRAENQRLQQSRVSETPRKPGLPELLKDAERALEFKSQDSDLLPDPRDIPGKNDSQPRSILESQPDKPQISRPEEELPSLNLPPSDGLQVPDSDASRPAASPDGQNRSPASPTLNEGFNTDELLPPTIDPGEPIPPPQPIGADRATNWQSSSNALELNLSRIEVPAQLASQQSTLERPDSGLASDSTIDGPPAPTLGTAVIRPATELVKDQRVVELAFHPGLSRAANFDDRTDDDGLYLVLQPLNEAGQMVPIAADLTVLVVDPSQSEGKDVIGRRDYSAREVQAKMQPIGTNQGIHLTMPWNGPNPGGDRVFVLARYTFADGRQVVGEKTIFVSSEGGLKTVWAPRGTSRREVVTASSDTSSEGSDAIFRSSGATSTHSSVVRPAVGNAPAQPAPLPKLAPPQ